MRILFMLRTLDESGGICMYSRYLIRELLRWDKKNQYYLLYRSPSHKGQFSEYPNVTELVAWAPNTILWDQCVVPYFSRKVKADLIFNPKFTVPFFAQCKTIMVVHGADWFIPEHAKHYRRSDVMFNQFIMPKYCHKASKILSVSEITTDHFKRIFHLPDEKIETVYFGPASFFQRVTDPAELQRVKERYHLPDQFIFTLTKPLGDSRKNLGAIFDAYEKYHQASEKKIPLVVGGKDCDQYREKYQLATKSYGSDVLFPGWLRQKDLPAIYSMATYYLYPSNVEAFPIPITEAMACGTPIITSDANGLKEIAGEAAVFVDQENSAEISQAMLRLDSDVVLQRQLSEKGIERSQMFCWEKCAKTTLKNFEQVVN